MTEFGFKNDCSGCYKEDGSLRGKGRSREPNCTKADERWCWPRLGWWPFKLSSVVFLLCSFLELFQKGIGNNSSLNVW